MDINYLEVIAAVVASFVVSAVWYMIFGTQLAKLNPKIYGNPGESQSLPLILVELGRNIVLSLVLLYLVTQLKTENWILDEILCHVVEPIVADEADAFKSGFELWLEVVGQAEAGRLEQWRVAFAETYSIAGRRRQEATPDARPRSRSRRPAPRR